VTTGNAEKGWSITWVIVLLIALTMAIIWCFIAGEHTRETQGWTPAGREFIHGPRSMGVASIAAWASLVYNGVAQLPNAFSVIAFGFEYQFWTIVGTGILVGLLAAGGVGLKLLEKQLDKPYSRTG